MKSALIGREISDELDLLELVTEALNGISDPELQRVFRSWTERIQRVNDARGDSLTE
jgi:hypothetical protein